MMNDTLRAQLSRYQRLSLIVGGVATLLSIVGILFDRGQFFQSYLFAYIFWFGITLGSLAFIMVHHLAGGRWSASLRGLLEASSRTMPLIILLFLPIVLGISELYEWSHPEIVAGDRILEHKAIYLNVPFFLGRAAFYFMVWGLLAFFLNRWSRQYDENADPDVFERLKQISAPGLVIYALTMSFASFDWLMSLEPHWFSTIFGAMITIGSVLTALAFITLLACHLSDQPPFSDVLTAQQYNDFGSLLLAFIMLWAYGNLSQALLIWSANLGEEITWYLHRVNGGWEWVSLALMIFHFVLPFALLLSRDLKRNPKSLIYVAFFMLIMRLIDLFWIVQPTPAFHHETFSIHWLDIVTPLAVGGLWLAFFFRELKARPLLPVHDPQLKGEVHHGHAAHEAV
jgi:hypothetical protein